MAAASSSGSLGSTTTSPTRNMNGADDMEGSKKNHARASNIARKLQEKLISDSQNLVSCGFAELPAVINLSFVLENVAGAVKECHVQKIKSDQPKSTLFDWIWNEKEIPKLIVLGSWWLCALLTQGKTPIGKEIGSLSEFGIEVLKKVEDVSLRGLAKIFSTMLSHHAIEMKHHGGVAAHRASHAIFSSILPDAIARATRDCAFLTWPHLRPFLETPECCTALVGVWSYLITGDKGSHLFAKNIEYSKVKNWGIPTDLAPTQLHLRKAEADQPSTFPALERRRQRERAIRDRVMLVQENNRLLALPYHEREMIERMKKNAASTCPMGIPLKPTEPLTGQEKGPPRMRHGRFVLGTSPLVELSMATTSMTVDSTGGANTADIVNIDLHSTHSDLSMREDDMSLGSEKRSVMTRRLSLSEMLSPPPVNDTRVTGLTGRLLGLQGSVQQRAESRKQNMAKRGETVVSLTFAPPVYEVQSLLQRVSVDSQQEVIPSLYASLLGKSAIRPLGEAPEVSTLVHPNQWGPDANMNLRPLKQISRKRVHLKQTEGSDERNAMRQAAQDRMLLEKRRAAVLDSKLDVIDHARKTRENAFLVSPAPVSMVQVHKVMDYHVERGTLPRHHAVRLESFSRR